jgi:hypothetical protein
VVDEMLRGLDHPSCPTGWAEASAFAGKSNQVLVTVTIALDSNEAVFEAQAAMELVDDEGGQHLSDRPGNARVCLTDPGEVIDLKEAEPARFQSMLSGYQRFARENGVMPLPVQESCALSISP